MVKQGGYATGGSYRWYRNMGHGTASALFMLVPATKLFIAAAALGLILGLISSRLF